MKSSKKLQKIDAKIAKGKGNEELHKRREMVTERFRNSTRLFYLIIITPLLLFWLTIVSSLERTPLTGRWRLILLSPDEEEDIAAQLAGPGWYRAVGEILMRNGPTRLIDSNDWRYQWVQNTLRRLEGVIPVLSHEEQYHPDWMECGPGAIPQPPPAKYPLRPRPRASDYFRQFAEAARHRTAQTPAHSIPGPPYSLLVVDDSESSNAFSYGFGPDGGGGVVVFSGFIDDVLRKHPHAFAEVPQPVSWWSYIVGGFFGLTPHGPTRPVPTEEQTEELAVLLAHELAHLVLTHHIETLSTGTIIWPGVITICTDIVRSFLFPLTMLCAYPRAMCTHMLTRAACSRPVHKRCARSPWESEFGRDLAHHRVLHLPVTRNRSRHSLRTVRPRHLLLPALAPGRLDLNAAHRLLAHAGFDPRRAVQFWEGRAETPQTAECTPGHAEEVQREESDTVLMVLPRRWISSSHPVNIVRVQKLRQELERWEDARRVARERREKERGATRDNDQG